ncbi:HAD family hydrolase, partial [Salmonella enterica]|nr:HAD family hydrolase [Salmonella enterica]
MDDKKLIIFFDSGDTIVDESTEIRDEEGIVLTADLIPGADI